MKNRKSKKTYKSVLCGHVCDNEVVKFMPNNSICDKDKFVESDGFLK